ncbi:S-layer homology domain-containing protein [Lysinibacillus sphaericus]|uniref:S-layer homology domain-containing protein n=1 Tax=Lysinibacillus TaxID=400634 RepID=UPI0009B7D1DF
MALSYKALLTIPFQTFLLSHAYYKDIQALYALGITTGYADNTFKPSGIVTRQNISP